MTAIPQLTMRFIPIIVTLLVIAGVSADLSDSVLEHHVFAALQARTSHDVAGSTLGLIQLLTHHAYRVAKADAQPETLPLHMQCIFNRYKDVIFGDVNEVSVKHIYVTLMTLSNDERRSYLMDVETCVRVYNGRDAAHIGGWSKHISLPYTWADTYLLQLDLTKLQPLERGFYFYALWELFTMAPFPPRYMRYLDTMMEQYNDDMVVIPS